MAVKRPLLRKIDVLEQKLGVLPTESSVTRHERNPFKELIESMDDDPGRLARENARTEQIRALKNLEFENGVTWIFEEVTMGALDDLKNDPSFIEEVKEMLRNDLKGITRGLEFRKALNHLMKEHVDDIASSMLEESASEIKARAKEIIDAELGPAMDRALRQAIEEHVSEIRKRSGL